MLFGDGAGASVVTAEEYEEKRGVLGYSGYSDCMEEIDFLKMDKPRSGEGEQLYVRMTGRSVFKYAVNRLPQLITECMNSLSISIKDIKAFIFHQANGKMLDAIGAGLSEMNGGGCIKVKTPLTLNKLGNTSVATIPTLLDLILRDKMDEFKFQKDQKVVMASVGAGMHANCMVYQF
jgi:3-oxoacyl-[acyl-carrier-protein] synthase-3